MNTARQSTARTLSANLFENSHGQCTARTVRRGTDRPAPFWRQKRALQPSNRALPVIRKQIIFVIATVVLIAILAAAARRSGFVFVATDSSCPIGIYRFVHKPLARGALVEVCLPDAIASYGIARGYIRSGDCPNDSEPLIKLIGAFANDRVDLSLADIRVNGEAEPDSATRLRDTRGREVRSVPRGSYETRAGQVWLFGLNDARSWDSRYFGPMPATNVLGTIEPVFTLDQFARLE